MPQLFIARTTSMLPWLRDVPPGWRVTVQDLRGDLPAQALPEHVARWNAPVAGGLPAAYLDFMASGHFGDAQDVTVFCPEDPLAHSPDFFALLDAWHLWGKLQPLSSVSDVTRNVPPASVLMHDTRDQFAGLSVRAERFSLSTLQPVAYLDTHTQRRAEAYRQKHDLPAGSNLLAHFLSLCSLESLAEQARGSDVGVHVHGHLFGVHNTRLVSLQRRFAAELSHLALYARSEHGDDLMFERLWLHLLGESFIRFDTNERPDDRAEPVDKAMARVVASIDAVLAQATTPHGPRATAPVQSLSGNVETLRERAKISAAAGRADEARRLLQQALTHQPSHLGALTDAAGLAWQTGDLNSAVQHARAALSIDLRASTCVYVLGMALIRAGDREEARSWLNALATDEMHQAFRQERPDLADAAQRELLRLKQMAA